MGVSKIQITIERLVLNGLEPPDRKALLEGLQTELAQILSDPAARAGWGGAHRTPVLKLGRMPIEPGPAGGRKFGGGLARAIGKGLRP